MITYTYVLYSFCLLALLAVGFYLFANRNDICAPKRSNTKELTLLLLLTLLFSLLVYGKFLVGNTSFAYSDVGSDTIDQYIPYYINLLNRIREANLSPWNPYFGLGASFYSYQTWTLDPANLIWLPLCLIFGDSFLSKALVISQIIKLLLSALLFWQLSKNYCKAPIARISSSLIYCFSAVNILWGQHYWIGSMPIICLALLNILEASLKEYKLKYFIAICALSAFSIITSTYDGYIILFFSAIYALIRSFTLKSTNKDALISYLKLAVPVICGIVISCITLIPYATSLMNESARLGSSASSGASKLSFFSFVPLSWILPILSRLLGASLLTTQGQFSTGTIPETIQFTTVNTYEMIQLSLSVVSLFLLMQLPFVVKKRSLNKRSKICLAIAAILCFLYMFNYFLPALSNVFVDPKYRSSFYICIPLSLAAGWILDYIAENKKLHLGISILSILITLAVLVFSGLKTSSSRYIALLYLTLFGISAFTIALIGRVKVKHSTLLLVGVTVLVTSSICDAWFVTNWRQSVPNYLFPKSNLESPNNDVDTSYMKDSEAALAWLKSYDSTYYRVDKLYVTWSISDNLISDYSSINNYNSTMDADIIHFNRTVWPGLIEKNSSFMDFRYDWNKPDLLRVLGEKYILATEDPNVDWLYPLKTFGSVTVYGVEGATGPLYTKDAYVPESQIDMLPAEDKANTLGTLAVVPDIAVPMLEEMAKTQGTYNVVDLGPNNPYADSAPAGTIKQPDELYFKGTSAFEGRITATQDGQVGILAIPYTSSIKVTVDGTPTETFKADYGLIGFGLNAGEHAVHIQYEVPNLMLALCVSITGILLSFISGMLLFKKRQS